MDCFMFLERITHYPVSSNVQFLVSGHDRKIRNTVLSDLVKKAREKRHTLIVVDDTNTLEGLNETRSAAPDFQIRNVLSGEYCLYNPLKIQSIQGTSKLRQLLASLEYDEKNKMKLIAYLNFIRHIERLGTTQTDFVLNLEKLGKYCTNQKVAMKLESLVQCGKIDKDTQFHLLAKYSEVCSAAADFEDMLFILSPFISGKSIASEKSSNQIWVLPTGELGSDLTLRNVVMQLLQFHLEEEKSGNTTVLIFDKGYGERTCILNLLKSIPARVTTHIFSEDIFSLCDPSILAIILNRFPARVYGRHLSMNSCLAIEKACGEIDVTKKSYNVSYDRRFRANRPWDILMGNNKTESYTTLSPVREARYRKEMIMSFAPGNGIVEFMGNTSLFTL